MAQPINNLSVEVKATVVPVLKWGEEEVPVHDLLRDRILANQAFEMLHNVLHDLDHMQRHSADAKDSTELARVLHAQQGDHAKHAQTIRDFLRSNPR